MADDNCNYLYSSIEIFIDNQSILLHDLSPDHISGICVSGFAQLSDFYAIVDNLIIHKLGDINKLSKSGPYISSRNKTTDEALECSREVGCHLREIEPEDDGTQAVWIFDHDENDGPRWNLIMTDNIKEFISGFKYTCKILGTNMWDYILGEPIGSEGVVLDWDDVLIN